ncbi:MAG: 2-C-methyl-D-erythritol 4-phosphate cytidylyltransferase [Acidimicrobiales bacterium]
MPQAGRGGVWAIVLAAGRGSRFGGSKQFELLGGRSMLAWSVGAVSNLCDGVVVALPPGEVTADASGTGGGSSPLIVAGGSTRSASVRAALSLVPDDVAVIVIHDAARPLAPVSAFMAVVAAVEAGADAAVTALPVTDTIYEVADDQMVAPLDRSRLRAVQTPQAFRAAALRAAHQGAPEATDDASLVAAGGGSVRVVPGHERSRKVTTPEDLDQLRYWVASNVDFHARGGSGQ